MSGRRRVIRLLVVAALQAPLLVAWSAPASAGTKDRSGTRNCGTKYVSIDLSGATGGSLTSQATMHLDYGPASNPTASYRNFTAFAAYTIDYWTHTRLHSVTYHAHLIGNGNIQAPTVMCIPAPKNYGTHVTKTGYKDCGSKLVDLFFRGYAFEADVDWNAGPTSRGHRVYAPVNGSYGFASYTAEHAVSWTMTARGVMYGSSLGPQFDDDRVGCY